LQILTKPTLFALDHVGQGFQRSFVGARDSSPTPAVVQQRIHRLLQHPFFVTDDDVWGTQLQQPLEPVVAIDHSPVEVIQVGGGETAAVERDQWSQVGRQHWQYGQYHPFRFIAGVQEGFHQLQPLRQPFELGFGTALQNFLTHSELHSRIS